MAESIRKTTFAHNVMTKYLEAREISRRLEHLAREVGWFAFSIANIQTSERWVLRISLCIC